MFGERSRCNLSPFLSLLLSFLGMVDGDCSEPPEVLAKKPACSLVGKVSLELPLPPSSHYSSGCLSLAGDGLQPAISVPSFVLFTVLALSYVRAFHVVAIPQSVLLAQVSLFWLHMGVPSRFLQSTATRTSRASLPCPNLLVADAGVCAAFLLGELLLGL